MGLRTPLYECHIAANAKMVDFSGWDMPINYGSQLDEHYFVRQSAGMFDVSHMNAIDIHGSGAREFLLKLLCNDIDKLTKVGKALYSCILKENGFVIDDLIVYRTAEKDKYRLVVNCSTKEKDIAWIKKIASGYDVSIDLIENVAMIAVQGPKAIELATKAMPQKYAEVASELGVFFAAHIEDWFIARTGYTGEDGFEITVPASEAKLLWDALLAVGVHPCGLGARDTLRLESGMNLYGSDMDETVSPLESNLAWIVNFSNKERIFIGRDALEQQQKAGIKRKLVGLVLFDRGVLRNHQKVISDNLPDGEITSGGFSPTLGKGIAFARVPVEIGNECFVDVRGKLLKAQVIKLPFVKQGRATF